MNRKKYDYTIKRLNNKKEYEQLKIKNYGKNYWN